MTKNTRDLSAIFCSERTTLRDISIFPMKRKSKDCGKWQGCFLFLLFLSVYVPLMMLKEKCVSFPRWIVLLSFAVVAEYQNTKIWQATWVPSVADHYANFFYIWLKFRKMGWCFVYASGLTKQTVNKQHSYSRSSVSDFIQQQLKQYNTKQQQPFFVTAPEPDERKSIAIQEKCNMLASVCVFQGDPRIYSFYSFKYLYFAVLFA